MFRALRGPGGDTGAPHPGNGPPTFIPILESLGFEIQGGTAAPPALGMALPQPSLSRNPWDLGSPPSLLTIPLSPSAAGPGNLSCSGSWKSQPRPCQGLAASQEGLLRFHPGLAAAGSRNRSFPQNSPSPDCPVCLKCFYSPRGAFPSTPKTRGLLLAERLERDDPEARPLPDPEIQQVEGEGARKRHPEDPRRNSGLFKQTKKNRDGGSSLPAGKGPGSIGKRRCCLEGNGAGI